MDGLAVLGFGAFIMVILLWGRVKRLERVLRENGIRPASARDLGRRLRQSVGREVTLTLWTQYGSTERLPCRLLDSDESWALLLRSEGKKQQRQVLIRLEDVKDVKLTAPGGGKKKEERS